MVIQEMFSRPREEVEAKASTPAAKSAKARGPVEIASFEC
jgi:hypothetical protein